MPISSLSTKRLQELLRSMSGTDTVGVDMLRDLANCARSVVKEVEDPAQRVLAWVLAKQLDAVCDRYDGDPITVDESSALSEKIEGEVVSAVRVLLQASPSSRDAVLAAETVILSLTRGH